MEKQIGKTKDVGFQFGIRKTYPLSSDKMWNFLFSENGLKLWLGQLQTVLELKKDFKTEKVIRGERLTDAGTFNYKLNKLIL